jgi:hypothetical protein
MSVLYAPHAAGPLLWVCADCGDEVRPPGVYWAGDTDLLFHAACALRVGAHLIADSREAELVGSRSAQWRRRARAVTRHRLLTEEAVA